VDLLLIRSRNATPSAGDGTVIDVVPASAVGPPPAGRALEIFVWSRLALWLLALFAFVTFSGARNPHAPTAGAETLHDLGAITDVWARWDSALYLRIAEHGYASVGGAPALGPLYPALVGVLGRALFGHYVLAGLLLSLGACLGAFVLFQRLGTRLVGAAAAERGLLYLAVFPMALFLQAVYSESLYLLLVLAAFALAERGRFLASGMATGLALLTRISALALLPALAVVAWRSERRGKALASLTPALLLFAAYPLILWQQVGDPFAFFHAESSGWRRHLSPFGPVGGVWDGCRAGAAGVAQLASGSTAHRYWTAPGLEDVSPFRIAAENLEQLAFCIVFIALAVVVWKRLGAAYGLFAAVSVAIPLSFPTRAWPLLSLSRFGLVVFPFFLALAAIGSTPRRHAAIVAVSSVTLGVAVAQWALWQWVA
jgi:hypothetical protein